MLNHQTLLYALYNIFFVRYYFQHNKYSAILGYVYACMGVYVIINNIKKYNYEINHKLKKTNYEKRYFKNTKRALLLQLR